MTFEEMYEKYIQYRRVCGRKEFTIYSNMTRFYNRRKNYNTPYLTQQMVDDWCKKSEGETNVSRSIRVFSILSFLRYVVVEKRWVDIHVPKTPPHAYETAIPHSFTDEELDNRCQDVNFENGIVNIVNTKGYRQHVVVLHNSMLKVLKAYHLKASQLVGPDRLYMFPCGKKKQIYGQLDLFEKAPLRNESYRSVEWLKVKFRKVWDKYNSAKTTTVGMLRHHYAILNINTWIGENQCENMKKLLALSKSMGHRTLASTMWYYSLVPRLADLIDNLPNDDFDKIIPAFEDEEI